jgi:hypothetical protein
MRLYVLLLDYTQDLGKNDKACKKMVIVKGSPPKINQFFPIKCTEAKI